MSRISLTGRDHRAAEIRTIIQKIEVFLTQEEYSDEEAELRQNVMKILYQVVVIPGISAITLAMILSGSIPSGVVLTSWRAGSSSTRSIVLRAASSSSRIAVPGLLAGLLPRFILILPGGMTSPIPGTVAPEAAIPRRLVRRFRGSRGSRREERRSSGTEATEYGKRVVVTI